MNITDCLEQCYHFDGVGFFLLNPESTRTYFHSDVVSKEFVQRLEEILCEECSVLFYDAENNEFEFFTAVGETGMHLVKERFPADKGIAGRALRERTTQVVNDDQILSAIADEVALAVKNARLFEYVIDSYCQIRQGKNSSI